MVISCYWLSGKVPALMTKLTSQGYRAGNAGDDPAERRAKPCRHVAIDRYCLDSTIGSSASQYIAGLPVFKRNNLVFYQDQFFVQRNF